MKITYGICVSPDYNSRYLNNLVESIVRQVIPPSNGFKGSCTPNDFEIILIGGGDRLRDEASHGNSSLALVSEVRVILPFDDTQKPGWITRKKNIIAQNAKFDNLFICHDYVQLGMKWREGVEKYYRNSDGDWKVMLNKVYNLEGTRHADWIVDPMYMEMVIKRHPEYQDLLMAAAPHENHPKYVAGLPYDVPGLSKYQYISGGSFLIKKQVLLDHPMNEDMVWGDPPGEDVEWSRRINAAGIRYNFNPYSGVMLQKPNKWQLFQMPDEVVNGLAVMYIDEVMDLASGRKVYEDSNGNIT